MTSKVVLITGASSGFGKACAEHLAGLGHRVYGTSRRARVEDGETVPGRVRMLPMDVREDDSVEHAVACVRTDAGRLDVLVNNAGLALAGAVEDTSVAEARDLFETNLFGAHRVCRAVLPILRAQGAGLIVNVSSLAGLVTVPFQGFYSASKYALESMTDALRMEVAPFGIQVVLIEPGDFKSGFTAARVYAAASGDGSPYAARCARAVGVMEHDEQHGADPTFLATLLAQAIAAETPRTRYPVGARVQTLAVRLRHVLPTRVLDRVLMRTYKV